MGIEGNRFEVHRVKLSDYIPMDTPFSVTMVPSSYCNFSCTFCPDRIMSHKAVMPFEMAKNIIDKSGFPHQVKMLSLYNVGEPLINRELAYIIRYAKEKGFSERVSTVTNASLLNEAVSRELISSGIDRIIISLYGLNDNDYLINTNRVVNFKDLYKNIIYLNKIKKDCQIFIKIIDRVTSQEYRKQLFIDLFKDHCDFYSFEPILPIWPNFKPEGDTPINIGLYSGVPAIDRIACHYPFYSMVVTARGFVTPCLADWNETVVLGDTEKNTLNEIWNSNEYQSFRLIQLAGIRKLNHLCKTCGTLKAATCVEDDIDEDRIKLLDKLFPGESI